MPITPALISVMASKLTVMSVLEIRERAARGESDADLAKAFGIVASAVQMIRTGKRHARVGGPRTLLEKDARKVTAFGGES